MTFNVGDIVKFNTGGPPMNVVAVSPDGLTITVLWVVPDDSGYSTAEVPSACLKISTGYDGF